MLLARSIAVIHSWTTKQEASSYGDTRVLTRRSDFDQIRPRNLARQSLHLRSAHARHVRTVAEHARKTLLSWAPSRTLCRSSVGGKSAGRHGMGFRESVLCCCHCCCCHCCCGAVVCGCANLRRARCAESVHNQPVSVSESKTLSAHRYAVISERQAQENPKYPWP